MTYRPDVVRFDPPLEAYVSGEPVMVVAAVWMLSSGEAELYYVVDKNGHLARWSQHGPQQPTLTERPR